MNVLPQKIIYFITGASGVGKTTLVTRLKLKYRGRRWAFLHFDSIGVPSLEEMEKDYGSPSAWQEAKTYAWIDNLLHAYTDEKVFLEGQVNLNYIRKGFERHNFSNYKIVLIDCSEEEMRRRLMDYRAQPELFNDKMRNWLEFLRSQATNAGAIVIDVSTLSEEQALQSFEEAVGL